MAEQFRQGIYAGIHANQRLGMAEQIHTTPSRAYLEQMRNESQPAAAPGTGLWTPNQAIPGPSAAPQVRSSSTYHAQFNYPAIPNTQYTPPGFNPAANPSSTNPPSGQQLLPPSHPPPTQEDWDALSEGEKARVREAQDTQAAVLASLQDQVRIETIVRSYAASPIYQAGRYPNNPYQNNNNIQSRSAQGQQQLGYGPRYVDQSSSRPPASSDIMCAFCGLKEAVCQHPSVAGGIRICLSCFNEMHLAENRRVGPS